MIIIRFDDAVTERRALGFMAGRFSFKTWANGKTIVPKHALASLAAEGILFFVEGLAKYEQLAATIRDSVHSDSMTVPSLSELRAISFLHIDGLAEWLFAKSRVATHNAAKQWVIPMTTIAKTLVLSFFLMTLHAASSQESAPDYQDKAKLLVWRDAGGKEHAVKTAADWAKRRAHIVANMEKVMGPLPDAKTKVALDVKYLDEVKKPRFVRKKLTFAVAKDDRVPGYLFLPVGAKGKVPAVLCLHQTNGALGSKEPAGLGGLPSLHYALHLAERGYVTLAIDYPSFGEYPYDFKKSAFVSGSMKAIWNNMRAIDLLQSLPEVDGERIGCIGHSLGGHNTMFTAVFEPRIKAIVSNCGFNAFPKYYKGDLRGWTSDRYMPRIAKLYDSSPAKVPFDFPEIVAAFAPRPFLASAPLRDSNFEVSGVKDCIAAALPVYELLGVKDRLAANYPDCAHDFPPEVRKTAYEFLDRWLKGVPR